MILPFYFVFWVGCGQIDPQPQTCAFIGEVSLSGHVRSVNGVLPMALLAARCGIETLYVPVENAAEASAADITVYGVHHISDLIAHLRDESLIPKQTPYTPAAEEYHETLDFADVKGQQNVRYAPGDRRIRRTQCSNDRQSRKRQKHARQAHSNDSAGDDPRGIA